MTSGISRSQKATNVPAGFPSTEETDVRYLDPRLSKLLAEQKVAQAQRYARPRQHHESHRDRLNNWLGTWMLAIGEILKGRDTETQSE